jgi:hypothetical protein
VIGYGAVQALAPGLFRRGGDGAAPGGRAAVVSAGVLALVPAGMAVALDNGLNPALVVIAGLAVFGVIFAVNSALHSYLILAYSELERVSMNVGFYYMANAGGRLAGTVLSGWAYQNQGMAGCLWWSAGFLLAAMLLSLRLPRAVSRTAH